MERIALFVNDAESAAPMIEALMSESHGRQFIIVLCPPRMVRRISRWTTQEQCRRWRQAWAGRLREDLEARLPSNLPCQPNWKVADSPLAETPRRLRQAAGTTVRLVDLRREPLGGHLESLEAATVEIDKARDWRRTVAVGSSVSAVLALVD